jgi:hypothetical protein
MAANFEEEVDKAEVIEDIDVRDLDQNHVIQHGSSEQARHVVPKL